MNKWSFWCGALALGVGLGVASGWSQFSYLPEEFRYDARLDDDGAASAQGGAKLAIEGDGRFDVGAVARDVSGAHAFVLRNEGTGPLTLEMDKVSCGLCLQTTFSSATVPPSESVNVEIHWTTRKEGPDFQEYVELYTNDPDQAVVRLTLTGRVVRPLWSDPESISIGEISANEPISERVKLFAFQSDHLEIVEHSFSNEDLAEFFEVSWEPLGTEELADEPDAKSGLAVQISTKPGLPLGALAQSVRLKTNLPQNATKEIELEGAVVGDIAILGGGNFRRDVNFLYLGSVSSTEGAKVDLHVLVKGPYRHDIQLQVEATDPPDVLQATIGPKTDVNQGAVVLFPLTVEVPRGTRTVNYLSTDHEENGKVYLTTTHPQAKRIVVYVRFAVNR